MSAIDGKTVFAFTSPRTPQRMVPELRCLCENFEGSPWDAATQTAFMNRLVDQDFYVGTKCPKDPAFSARDRVNRAPKGLGFVDLKPCVRLTEPGRRLFDEREAPEALLRQMMKFQIPSPYHSISSKSDSHPWGKPYLELLRLIHYFGSLTFDEFAIFGMQLVDYRDFDDIVAKIEAFREMKAVHQGSYKEFYGEVCVAEVRHIYHQEILMGKTKVREGQDNTLSAFLQTKRRNMRDYADAVFRYLSAAQVVTMSQAGHSLSIALEKIQDVEFVLENVPRDPVFVDDEKAYKEQLFDADFPVLYSDDPENLVRKIREIDPVFDPKGMTTRDLKRLVYDIAERGREEGLRKEIANIKELKLFDDIDEVFDRIEAGAYYDNPLMFEWNTWRAMVMLDGGEISANLKFDGNAKPLSTAAGNMPDIVCDYGAYAVAVEVTLQSGQKQYDNEGEPVARHIGKLHEQLGKPVYGIFVAPKISEATKAHFYMLRRTNVKLYGGKAQIVPISLAVFRKMVGVSCRAGYDPGPENILKFLKEVERLDGLSHDEEEWFSMVQHAAADWLSLP